jgi:hypothetical protein
MSNNNKNERDILKKNIDLFTNSYIFKDFNKNISNPPSINNFIKNTPTIPGIYFVKDCNNISNLNNNLIIDKYFEIYRDIKNLEKIKDNILSILDMSKSLMVKKILSKDQYYLDNKNFGIEKSSRIIFKFTNDKKKDYTSNFKTQTDFKNFVDIFIKENYNIFRGIETYLPYYFYIFQNEFSDKSSSYFINLFRKYNNLRDKLSNNIRSEHGILGFKSFFDIDFNTKKTRNNFKKNSNIKNNNFNYNKYLLEGNNSNNKSYLNENSQEAKSVFYLKSKIHEIDLLYLTFVDEEFIKNEHRENCYKNYEALHDSLDKIIGNGAQYNLYDITKNMIELDFNLYKFIFSYVEPELFNNIVINHYKIKNYISKKINSFERYFDLFIEWKEKIEGISSTSYGSLTNINKLYTYQKFEEFYNDIITKIKLP